MTLTYRLRSVMPTALTDPNLPCKGRTDLFYPDDQRRMNIAKAICAQCPVVDECLKYALDNREPEGVWGGLTPSERRTGIVRRRRRTVPQGTSVDRRPLNGEYRARVVKSPVGLALLAVMKPGVWYHRDQLVAVVHAALPDAKSHVDARVTMAEWLSNERRSGRAEYDGLRRWRVIQ